MGPDTLTTTRESQTFSSVTPPWEMVRAPIYESGACSFRVAGVRSVLGAVLRHWGKEKRPACRKAAKRFSAGI